MEELLKEMLPELSLIPNYTHPDVVSGQRVLHCELVVYCTSAQPIGSYEASRTVHVHSSKPGEPLCSQCTYENAFFPEFTFSPKEHVEIGESLGVLDFRLALKWRKKFSC